MRGYKIGDSGIIEDVYEDAPGGSKDKYDGDPGVYLETAINKLIARNVRYQDYISNKQKLKDLNVEVDDISQELKRIRGILEETESNNNTLTEDLRDKESLIRQAKEELKVIKKDIAEALGGVK